VLIKSSWYHTVIQSDDSFKRWNEENVKFKMSEFSTDSTLGLEDDCFDFIIIGGGTSGLVVANRLTEDLQTRVLVLEAGTNRLNDPRITVPALSISAFEDPDFDWNMMSIPQVFSHINSSCR